MSRTTLPCTARWTGCGALDRLRERTVARQARHRLGAGIAISIDAERIFTYAPTLEEAQEAARIIGELARDHHLTASATITQWDPEHERWEPASIRRVIIARQGAGASANGGQPQRPPALPCAQQLYRPSTADQRSTAKRSPPGGAGMNVPSVSWPVIEAIAASKLALAHAGAERGGRRLTDVNV